VTTDPVKLLGPAIAQLSNEKRVLLARMLEVAPDHIAIIGMAGRFPRGANDTQAFWARLRDGYDAVSEVPRERFDMDAVFDATPGATARAYSRFGALLDEVDGFDPYFFGISPREAERMDPQQRVLLEVATEALDDAGQVAETLAGTATGVFVGSYNNDYFELQYRGTPSADPYAVTGTSNCFLAGRLSYLLDLRGPSLVVDTACSSSLVAVHLACQSLREKECRVALAAGVHLYLTPRSHVMCSQMRMLSPDGRCKTFDAGANGFVHGEGCGVIVLKRLSDARTDGDRILAVIRGSAVNQDGRTNGLTAPNVLAQQAVVRQALERAGVSPAEVTYIETHGTGTALGDPIEVEALAAIYGAAGQEHCCALGALKANIGHLEAAAGIAGLIKVVLSLQHREIVPNPHFRQLNPRITLAGTRFYVPIERQSWDAPGKRVAAVSSFGMSGTNAHAILEEAEPTTPARFPSQRVCAFALSARTPAALQAQAQRYAEWARERSASPAESFRDVCYTSTERRTHFEYRRVVLASSMEELGARLAAGSGSGSIDGVAGTPQKIVFVFPGQGSQWLGMARDLIVSEPPFAASIEKTAEAIKRHGGFSVLDELHATEQSSQLHRIDIVQPTLFTIEVALATLWNHWGVVPDAVIGHSMGEVAAAHVAGALTLDDAARIVCLRSRLMRGLSGRGGMALVEQSFADAVQRIAGVRDRLSIAASNGPRSTVIAGDSGALDDLLVGLEAEGIFCRRIKVDVASHSSQVDPMRSDLLRALEGLLPKRAEIRFESTVMQRRIDGSECDAEYWVRNLRDPVMFAPSVEALLAEGHGVFIEMSPHPILSLDGMGNADAPPLSLPSMRRGENGREVFLQSVSALHVRGYPIRWRAMCPEGAAVCSLLPYPWERRRLWAVKRNGGSRMLPRARGLAIENLGAPEDVSGDGEVIAWQATLDAHSAPFLKEHRVQGAPVVPGAAFLELLLGAASRSSPRRPIVLENVRFHAMLAVPESGEHVLRVIAAPSGCGSRVRVLSRSMTDTSERNDWLAHADGRMGGEREDASRTAPLAPVDLALARQNCVECVDPDMHYQRMASMGLEYGEAFRGVRELRRRDGEVVARVQVDERLDANAASYRVHPALLDACLQTLSAAVPHDALGADPSPLVPVGIARIKWFGALPREVACHASLRRMGIAARYLAGDLTITDTHGNVLLVLDDFRAVRAFARDVSVVSSIAFRVDWQDLPPPKRETEARRVLVVSDDTYVGSCAVDALKSLGAHASTVPFETIAALRQVLGATDQAVEDIVFLAPLGSLNGDALEPEERLVEMQRACTQLVRLVQGIVRLGLRNVPRLWVVTRGAQDRRPTLVGASVWGIGSAIAQELPDLRCSRIDLPTTPNHTEWKSLAHEICAGSEESQVTLKDGRRAAARLVRCSRDQIRDTVPITIRDDGAYVITGGGGGLGLEVAEWLVKQGAAYILLVGRNDAGPEARARIDRLREAGADVHHLRADVASRKDVERILGTVDSTGRTLCGIVHAAGVLDDATLLRIDSDGFERVLRPKVLGALQLEAATRGRALDFFVCFSSVASLFGAGGQANYAAANAALCAVASAMSADDRRGLSIDWGPWAGIGLAAAEKNRGERLAERGAAGLSVDDGLAGLGFALSSRIPRLAMMRFDFRRWCEFDLAADGDPFFSEIAAEHGQVDTAAEGSLRDALFAAPVAVRRQMLIEHVRGLMAKVMRLAPERVGLHTPIGSLGFDSLASLEIRNHLERNLRLRLSATVVWAHPTLSALVEVLAQRLELPLEQAGTESEHDENLQITDAAEAAELLRQELAALPEEFTS
jgi:myxalamid-type polyketide synthase MxaE and MxaD